MARIERDGDALHALEEWAPERPAVMLDSCATAAAVAKAGPGPGWGGRQGRGPRPSRSRSRSVPRPRSVLATWRLSRTHRSGTSRSEATEPHTGGGLLGRSIGPGGCSSTVVQISAANAGGRPESRSRARSVIGGLGRPIWRRAGNHVDGPFTLGAVHAPARASGPRLAPHSGATEGFAPLTEPSVRRTVAMASRSEFAPLARDRQVTGWGVVPPRP